VQRSASALGGGARRSAGRPRGARRQGRTIMATRTLEGMGASASGTGLLWPATPAAAAGSGSGLDAASARFNALTSVPVDFCGLGNRRAARRRRQGVHTSGRGDGGAAGVGCRRRTPPCQAAAASMRTRLLSAFSVALLGFCGLAYGRTRWRSRWRRVRARSEQLLRRCSWPPSLPPAPAAGQSGEAAPFDAHPPIAALLLRAVLAAIGLRAAKKG
jgi:hypothetical protein